MALNAGSFMSNVLQMKPGGTVEKPKKVEDLVAGSSFDITESSLMVRSNRAFSDLLGLMAMSGLFLARAEAVEMAMPPGEAPQRELRIGVGIGGDGVGIGPPEAEAQQTPESRPTSTKKEGATAPEKAKPVDPAGPGK